MAKSCVYIPLNEDGSENKVFSEALKISDRNTAKLIWAISQTDELKSKVGKENMSLKDLDGLVDFKDIFSNEDYAKYIIYKEGLSDELFSSIQNASRVSYQLLEKYTDYVPKIQKTNDGYKIYMVNKTSDSVLEYGKSLALKSLNDKLIAYLNALGFDANINETDESYFDPANAFENADNLKIVISLAKGKKGEYDLAEEFGHFLAAGFRNHPIAQRLFNSITDDVVEIILGDSYEQYYNKYNGDSEQLKLEAIGKAIAQNLLIKENILSDVSYVSDRYLKAINNNLKKGDESQIDVFISETNQIIQEFISDVMDNDLNNLEYFSKEDLVASSKLYSLSKEQLDNIDKKTNEIIRIVTKRLKLIENKHDLAKSDLNAYNLMKKELDRKKYVQTILNYLSYCNSDCENIETKLKSLNSKQSDSIVDQKNICSLIVEIDTVVTAYYKTLRDLTDIKSDLLEEASEEDAAQIVELSRNLSERLFLLDKIRKESQVAVLTKILKPYWQDDIKWGKMQAPLKLQDVLESGLGDINGFTRLTQSLGDMSDVMLQMADNFYKDVSNDRDKEIFDLRQRLGIIQQRYTSQTGSTDTSFMYEKNKDGKLTGMLISPYDYNRWYSERQIEKNRLRKKYTKGEETTQEEWEEINLGLRDWEMSHTKVISYKTKNQYGKTVVVEEKVPIYESDVLQKLDSAQLEYYNEWIELKKQFDMLLPKRVRKLYRAPQKKIDLKDAVLKGVNAKKIIKRTKDRFVSSIDDIDFGEDGLDKNGFYVVQDIAGQRVKKVPIYYNVMLGDEMDLLDTNATDVMMSYGAMALNYKYMNTVADIFDTMLLQFKDREIKQNVGYRKLFERFKFHGDPYQTDAIKHGFETQEYIKLKNYIDKNIYGRSKEIEKITIGNTEINYGKIGDVLKEYATHVGLGFNAFSSMSNVSMGAIQNMLLCFGTSLFGDTRASAIKNLLNATRKYYELLPGGLMETYNDKKSNKLNLIIQKFDPLEDLYRETGETSFNNNIAQKIVGKFNPLIGMSAGEHVLHCVPAIAILMNTKVYDNGNKISLFDALEVTDKEITMANGSKEKYSTLSLKKGITKEDGTDFTDNDLFKIKLLIQEAAHKAHGAYGDIDKGDAHRHVLGRLLLQFRQWMPAFYHNRFQSERFNLKTGQTEEGYYRTAAKFLMGSFIDHGRLKFNIISNWKNLTKEQKLSIYHAATETSILYSILLLLGALGKPDKDDPWYVSMLKYNLYRLKTELGATAPTSPDFISSIRTILKSPMASVNQLDVLFDLFNFSDLFRTVKSGKYEGWNRYARTIYKATPYVPVTQKAYRFINGDIDPFKPFIN